jgi:hypothetical protein
MTQIPTPLYLVLTGNLTTMHLESEEMKMSFEIDTLCIIAPLDPNEGDRYNEPVNEDAQEFHH